MADPFVRPDVRQFLDYLNNLPGPKSHEVGPNEARTMEVALALSNSFGFGGQNACVVFRAMG